MARHSPVSDIATVMDGIAFHTQSLALHAAAEAARQGLGGEGLGVAAATTQDLAQHSARAARVLKTLQGDLRAASTDRESAAAQTMQDVVQRVQRAAETLRRLRTSAAAETRRGFSIEAAIAQLDMMGQQSQFLVDSGSASQMDRTQLFF